MFFLTSLAIFSVRAECVRLRQAGVAQPLMGQKPQTLLHWFCQEPRAGLESMLALAKWAAEGLLFVIGHVSIDEQND